MPATQRKLAPAPHVQIGREIEDAAAEIAGATADFGAIVQTNWNIVFGSAQDDLCKAELRLQEALHHVQGLMLQLRNV